MDTDSGGLEGFPSREHPGSASVQKSRSDGGPGAATNRHLVAEVGARKVSRGSLTVRFAEDGTLFLDEIGEMEPTVQARLERALLTLDGEEIRTEDLAIDSTVTCQVRRRAAHFRARNGRFSR